MTKAQWKAVYDFCNQYGFETPHELLKHLKRNGSVDIYDKLENLGEYAIGESYDGMMEFLDVNT